MISVYNRLIQFVLISALLISKAAVSQIPNILNYQGRIAVRGMNFDGTGQFKFALVDGGTTTTPIARTATGTAVITSSFVTSITVSDGGAGYTGAPSVTLTGGGGSGATATASVVNGVVTSFTITSPGSGYTSAPTVSIASPPEPTATTSYVTYWSNDGTSVAGSEPVNHVTLPVSKGLFSVRLGDTSLMNNAVIPLDVFDKPDLRLRIWFSDGTKGWQQLSADTRLLPSFAAIKTQSPIAALLFREPNVGNITGELRTIGVQTWDFPFRIYIPASNQKLNMRLKLAGAIGGSNPNTNRILEVKILNNTTEIYSTPTGPNQVIESASTFTAGGIAGWRDCVLRVKLTTNTPQIVLVDQINISLSDFQLIISSN